IDRTMRRRGSPAGAADLLRPTIFGDAALDAWVARDAGDPGEPWDSFERARQLVQAGHREEAVRIWQQIAVTDGMESRHTLQAWHFLRQAGLSAPADRARLVLGVAVEMPMRKGHDLLAAYRDGTARYLNYSGKAVIWEDHSDTRIQAAITDWLTAGQLIAGTIGVWEQPSLPPLPAGEARLMMLTPGGHRFGQAPVAALSQDPKAGPFLAAATRVLQFITSRAVSNDPAGQ
ncbi:MAG TPA: hypothetical protein VKU60_04380, partial [Chloroflexota bacterium]|nr:hypothetical protein [Chloroflexota bacterium]